MPARIIYSACGACACNKLRASMPAPIIYNACGACACRKMRAGMPAPMIYNACGACGYIRAARKHACDPLFAVPAVPADIPELRLCSAHAVSHKSIQMGQIQKGFYRCLRGTFGPAKRNLRVVSVALISPDLPRLHASSPIGGPKVYADFTHARSLPDLRCARYSNRLRLRHATQSGSLLLPRFVLSPLPTASVLPLVFSGRYCSLLSARLHAHCHSYILFPSASIISGVQITPAPTRACPSVHNAPTTTVTRTPLKTTPLVQC